MNAVGAVIVVAGGRSRRFGSDKLQQRIGGRTLLERTVAAAAVGGPVVLVGAVDVPDGIAAAVSEWPRWGGPCAAIAAALDALHALGDDVDVIVVPADLADPVAAVSALAADGPGVVVDGSGRRQWLLARAGLGVLRARLGALRGEQPVLDGLPAAALLSAVEARHAAPHSVCADIDTPADLARVQAQGAGPRKELLHGTV